MIILNKMYSGNYLEENIGHEFINDYLDSEGNQYIYVTPWQKVQKSKDQENYIIQIRHAGTKRYEVLFYAEIEDFSVDNDGSQLVYGGFKLEELLGKNDTNAGIYAHLKAKYIKKCRPNTYLSTSQRSHDAGVIELNSNFNFGRQRRYVHENEQKEVYHQLLSFIKNKKYWSDCQNSELEVSDYTPPEINILDVVGKQYEELAFSNWLAFYLNFSPILRKKFIEECLFKNANIVNNKAELLKGSTSVRREHQRTDIWLESEQAIIIIENKIDSGINGVRQTEDGNVINQLDDYKSLIEKENKNKQPYYFIIKPNYNQLTIDKKNDDWNVIEYETILEFFAKISEDESFKALPYIQEFVKALTPLTHPRKKDYKDIIKNRLMERIAALNKKKVTSRFITYSLQTKDL